MLIDPAGNFVELFEPGERGDRLQAVAAQMEAFDGRRQLGEIVKRVSLGEQLAHMWQ